MKKLVVIFLILLLAGSSILFYNVQRASAADSTIIQWTKTYQPYNQSASCLVQTSNGGYAIAGTGGTGQPFSFGWGFIINTDSMGNLIWDKMYSIGFHQNSVSSLVQTMDNGFALIMNGRMTQSVQIGNFLIKTDAAGTEMWRDGSIGSATMGIRRVSSVVQASDGGLVWGGDYQVLPNYAFLNKTDLSDHQIWGKTYPGQFGFDVIQTTDSGLAMTGQKADRSSFLMKTDLAGNTIWAKTYGNFGIGGLLQTSDGGFAFQGNGLLFKADALGNLQWTQTCTGTLGAQTSDGGYLFLSGNTLMGTDSTGNVQWSHVFDATLSSIVKTSSQEYVIAGTYPSSSSVNSMVWLTKISLAPDYDWPMFHHDAGRTGSSMSTAPATNQTLWSFATGGSVSSSPAVVNGVVYFGSADGSVYALDADGGSKLWSFATGGSVSSSPAVVNGVVYFGSADGSVYALDADGGSKLWSYATGNSVSSSPAVANGIVYVGSSSNMYALNASTGNVLWSLNGGAVSTSPTVSNDIVYVVLWGGVNGPSLYALNASTGTQLRSSALGNHGGGTVAVANGIMYGELSLGVLSASNATTGSGIWSQLLGNFAGPCPAIANGVVYASIDRSTNNVYALDAYTGNKLWTYSTGAYIQSSPAFANGVVYVGSNDGNVYALDASTGNKLWSYATDGAVVSSPAIANGKVYVGSNDGKLYCFGQPKSLGLSSATGWYWTGNTVVNSVAVGDVNGDGQKEVVSGGYFNDGTRNVAQLIVWDSSRLVAEHIQCWYWTGNTVIKSVALGDVDGDGQVEIVTGGYFNDGARDVAQLVEWSGANLAVDRLKTWYWTGNTAINSVALGDVDGDGQVEVVTGGSFFDGSRSVAQLIEWNGANLSVDRLTGWYWTGNTVINSVALGNVDSDGQVEVVTGGYFNDGARNIAQLIEWNGANLSVDRLTSWYWTSNTAISSVALGDVDGDGQVEVVSGGYFYDGSRAVAQLIEWNGANLSVDRLTCWYWNSDTYLTSVALGDVDGDSQIEVVSGGYFYDGSRAVAQLIEWNGANLGVDRLTSWYWTNDTVIYSVASGDVDGDGQVEVVTGGAFFDGTRANSQLTVWGMM